MRRICWLLLLLTVPALLGGCGGRSATAPTPTSAPAATSAPASSPTSTSQLTTLAVFAATSFSDAFKEIGKDFETAHPGVNITFGFAGSQQLAQQIHQGALADVFVSADEKQMEALIQSGQIVSGTQQIFARTRLVAIYPKRNSAGVATLADLAKPGVKLDLPAKSIPAGQYALEFFTRASLDPAFGASFRGNALKNIVAYRENAKAVLASVVAGDADAGIVYATDVAPDMADKVGELDIPDRFNTVLAYPIAPLRSAKNAALARQFVDYVLSRDAQRILARYRFAAVV